MMATAGAGGPDRKASGAPGDQSLSMKDKKRMEAEERNRLSKIKSAIKKELAAAEEKIAGLEARKAASEQALCDPQTHRDSAKIKELQIDLNAMENELADAYRRWEELSCKLEEDSKESSDMRPV